MFNHQKTHNDQIWISESKEVSIVKSISNALIDQGFLDNNSIPGCNYGFPNSYIKGNLKLVYRLVDSLYLNNPEVWNWEMPNTIITDNIALTPVSCHELTVLPEFWHIWYFDPVYQDRPATKAYNCFMNRPRGDRSTVFYELIKRNILNQGIVSYNCTGEELEQQFINADLQRYQEIHNISFGLLPYNTVQTHGTLEQCIVDSNVSLVLETYTSDSHIVFSEKIFRALQLPRPWLLYCSPGSVALLKRYGFDVLDEYVDASYDNTTQHHLRLLNILDQLETFINRQYTKQDYQRFAQAALHNQTLLATFAHNWPPKFDEILNRIKEL